MKTSHGPECTICIQSFEKPEDLEKHVAEKHSGKSQNKHNCNVCQQSFDSSEGLRKHTQDSHTFKCSLCELSFNGKDELTEHSKAEHGVQCALCNFTCKDNDVLSIHLKETHALAHACSVCERDFESKENLKSHMEKEHYSDCHICGKQFKTSTDLKTHLQECKIYTCGECNDIYYEQGNLNDHIEKKHKNKCNICKQNLTTQDKLQEHIKVAHRFRCTDCDQVEESQENLDKHKKENHAADIIEVEAFEWECCDFEGRTVEVMREHVIRKHTKKDMNNQFGCDDCDFKCDKRDQLLSHYRKEHKKKPDDDSEKTDKEVSTDFKEEHRQLKNNFERLSTLFQESLEEVDKVKSEYTAKLLEATEKYRVTLKENEELKEKVEILFKLGRSYIDRVDPVNSKARTDKPDQRTTPEGDHVVEEPEPETESENLENLSAWSTNKYRGFRRVSPTSKAEPKKVKENSSTSPPTRASPNPRGSPPAPEARPGQGPATTVNERLQNLARNSYSDNGDSPRSIQYCHFFTNYGKCNFEEKTGYKCKFEHKVAPMCQNGTACNRIKCMYTHPNSGGRNTAFLERSSEHNNMSPWQSMMNPLMNPWNLMTMNPFQNQTMAPFQNQTMAPFQNQTMAPFQNQTMAPFQNQTMAQFQNQAGGRGQS